ncbi:50S ribosomal protein L9 [Candidatus Poribacteria bacterium]|nr:50S ribosomal protein L9 [Candidatus Poribacteria bacterium]
MKVVLFRSVDNLGSAGDVVDVRRGYYRNFLGPRGYAKLASRANLALMESQRKKIALVVARERNDAQAAAQALAGASVKFELRANDKGQLFGSVTTSDIAKALAEQGHEIDRRKIELSEHIKAVGTFHVRIRLYPEVYGEVSVTVERLLRPEERQALEEEQARAEAAAAQAAAGDSAEDAAEEQEPVPAASTGENA